MTWLLSSHHEANKQGRLRPPICQISHVVDDCANNLSKSLRFWYLVLRSQSLAVKAGGSQVA